MSGEILFSGKEDVEDWESVDSGSANQDEDYNSFEIEFIDTDELEEGDIWIGEYQRVFQFDGAQSPSILFENEEEEVTYAFPYHVALRTQLADTDLEDNHNRADNPVESGETVAVVYEGEKEIDGQPMAMKKWDLRRPPE